MIVIVSAAALVKGPRPPGAGLPGAWLGTRHAPAFAPSDWMPRHTNAIPATNASTTTATSAQRLRPPMPSHLTGNYPNPAHPPHLWHAGEVARDRRPGNKQPKIKRASAVRSSYACRAGL